jgi:hypothetical protein
VGAPLSVLGAAAGGYALGTTFDKVMTSADIESRLNKQAYNEKLLQRRLKDPKVDAAVENFIRQDLEFNGKGSKFIGVDPEFIKLALLTTTSERIPGQPVSNILFSGNGEIIVRLATNNTKALKSAGEFARIAQANAYRANADKLQDNLLGNLTQGISDVSSLKDLSKSLNLSPEEETKNMEEFFEKNPRFATGDKVKDRAWFEGFMAKVKAELQSLIKAKEAIQKNTLIQQASAVCEPCVQKLFKLRDFLNKTQN